VCPTRSKGKNTPPSAPPGALSLGKPRNLAGGGGPFAVHSTNVRGEFPASSSEAFAGHGKILGNDVEKLLAEARSRIEAMDGPIERET
jgi:hypothetical protein